MDEMTVSDLITALTGFSPDTKVRFSYDYGDRAHHNVAHAIKWVDLQPVKYSSYVDDFIINDNEEGEFIEDGDYDVVLS